MSRFAPTTAFGYAQAVSVAMSLALVVLTWMTTLTPLAA